MGFFSNLFKKKENTQPAPTINITVKTGVVTNDPDIPPLQGDYAKTVFCGHTAKHPLSKIVTATPDTFCMSVESEMLPNITENSSLPAILKKPLLSKH